MQTLATRRLSDAARGARRRRRDRLAATCLRQMVAKTQFAITGEDTRYFLNGALFVLRPDSMSLVATDGHRLALVTRQARRQAQVADEESKVILPEEDARSSSARLLSRRRRRRDSTSAARTTCSSASAAGC